MLSLITYYHKIEAAITMSAKFILLDNLPPYGSYVINKIIAHCTIVR